MTTRTQPLTLADFLLARIDEDIAQATEAERWFPSTAYRAHTAGVSEARYVAHWNPDRVIAHAQAVRQVVELCTRQVDNWVTVRPGVRENRPVREPWLHDVSWETLQLLAQPYASHPLYRQEWTP